jgi:hypothetical protein
MMRHFRFDQLTSFLFLLKGSRTRRPKDRQEGNNIYRVSVVRHPSRVDIICQMKPSNQTTLINLTTYREYVHIEAL